MKQDWKISKLGEVYDVRDGTHDSPKYVKVGFALITSKNLKNDTINYDNVNYILEEDYININKRSKVDRGDVLFAMIGTIGNPVVVEKEPDYAIKNVALFKVPKEQDSYFLKYYLDSSIVIDNMSKDAKGVTQKFVGLGYLRNFTITLPPLPEQKQIVSVLDEAFASIAKAKANAEQNLKNAKELFESICNKELWQQNKNCPQKKLAEIVDNNRGGVKIGPFGSALKIGELIDKGDARVLYIENIVNNKFDWRKEKYITNGKFNELRNYEVFSGDVLITIMGTIGRTAIVPENLGRSIISSHLIKITPNRKIISSEFLNYSLNSSPFVVQQLFGQAKGAIMKGINSKIIKDLLIPLPAIKEQLRIVQKLNAFSAETKRLEANYQLKVNDLEELKKSILQKAFNGELKTINRHQYELERS